MVEGIGRCRHQQRLHAHQTTINAYTGEWSNSWELPSALEWLIASTSESRPSDSFNSWMEVDSIQLSFHFTNEYISAQMKELINEWMNMHQWMIAAYSNWFPSYPAQYQSWMTQHYSLLIGVVAMVWCAFPCHYTFCSGAHDDYDIQIREIRVFSR